MRPTAHVPRIVADGAERLRQAKNYKAVKQRISAEVRQRYADELKHAKLWQRVRLEAKILREMHAALAKQFPRAALYLAARAR